MIGLHSFVKSITRSSIPPAAPCGEPQLASCRSRADKSPRSLFSPSDIKVPPSLVYHLSDIWLTELDKVCASAAVTLKPVPLKLVLAPFLTFAATTPSKAAYKQIQTNLIDPLLAALFPPPEPGGPSLPKRSQAGVTQNDFSHLLANSCLSPSDEPSDRRRLLKGVLEYLFEVASREDTKGSNRRKLYAICNANLDEDDDS